MKKLLKRKVVNISYDDYIDYENEVPTFYCKNDLKCYNCRYLINFVSRKYYCIKNR